MEKKTNIVNQLPVKTWNRLNVNDSVLEQYEAEAPCPVQIETENGTAQITDVAEWEDNGTIATGVGSAIDHLFPWAVTVTAWNECVDTVRMEIGSTAGKNCTLLVNGQAEKNSNLTIVQIWKADAPRAALRTMLHAEKGATIRLIQILTDQSEEIINDVGGVAEEGATIELVRLYTAKGSIFSGVRVDMIGDNSSFSNKCGYLVHDGKKLDMNVIANHIGKNTMCDIQANGTLENHAEKVFRGTIDLRCGCSGSEGKEEENVLLLGDDVINKTIPLILCSEEDVKGSHGATIGELEQGMLFYFESRGISKSEAEKIVAKARLEKLCQDVADEKTAAYMHQMIDEVL